MVENNKVRIFTDGACSGNPGPGGWGAIVLTDRKVKKIGGYEIDTTNNRMELKAVIEALVYASNNGQYNIEIHADSAYVVNAIQKGWLKTWKRTNWKTSKMDDIKNKDLWTKLDDILSDTKLNVDFVKVKGHDGILFNEMADEEARRNTTIAKEQNNKNGEVDW